jgi:hypothetical protein
MVEQREERQRQGPDRAACAGGVLDYQTRLDMKRRTRRSYPTEYPNASGKEVSLSVDRY